MSQTSQAGNNQLLTILKATLEGIEETKKKHDNELAVVRRSHDAAQAEYRNLGGAAQAPKKTIFGMQFGAKSIGKITELQTRLSELSNRIQMLRHLIQDCDNAKEKAIDAHLLATDDHYRVDSMRWNAVVRLKHSLELYCKATDRAAILVDDLRLAEASRAESGFGTRDNQELLEHSNFLKAVECIKEGYDGYGKAVEDIVLHYGGKVTCTMTITYHGGTLKFDIYKHPESLSLYKIESLEEALEQIEGLKRAIKGVLVHVETLYNTTIAERLKYNNRLMKSLSA